jgi:hypothetical protein
LLVVTGFVGGESDDDNDSLDGGVVVVTMALKNNNPNVVSCFTFCPYFVYFFAQFLRETSWNMSLTLKKPLKLRQNNKNNHTKS